MEEKDARPTELSRRQFVRGGAAAALLPSIAVLDSWAQPLDHQKKSGGPASRVLSLDPDWRFGGILTPEALEPGFNDTELSRITLPHCVAKLSWQNWDPKQWQDVWIYRKHFVVPEKLHGLRMFLCFDRVMEGATPVLNGTKLPQHLGGFLPFEYEVTDLLEAENVLSVAVDSRWLNVPPSGSPKGPRSIDYLLPGGISGGVSLRAVPAQFIRDVFAKPVRVLDTDRRLEVTCRVDWGKALPSAARLQATLYDGVRPVATVVEPVEPKSELQDVQLVLGKLGGIRLWDIQRPYLYDVVVTLFVDGNPVHDSRTRLGFRDAHFEVDGFYLNGSRLRLFGLDRHELYPYVGFSASQRMLRRDAEILRNQLNCNAVRCSHYPQSPAFLDACDELGLLVWEEIPGWQYLGDESWKKFVLRDVKEMVLRDRNHPSIIIWGVRVNESQNDPPLYKRTREIAKSLDDSRPTSGSMTPESMRNWQTEWHQDVFAFDDYHSNPDGSVGIQPPLPGVPYLVTETVGQFDYGHHNFLRKYARAGDPAILMQQALLHAQAHSKAASYSRCAGAIAWCAFDYGSLMNSFHAVKCPGVSDVFRVPKLGAAFYLAQVEPGVRPVIEPDFYWDFGPRTPDGPGERAAIFSNCDRLELFFDGKLHEVAHPDRVGFPGILYPPFFANLKLKGTTKPELRIDGYVRDTRVVSRSFSADPGSDLLSVWADDRQLQADGADATRLVFQATDKFGAPRPYVGGKVSFALDGPGILVGDNPFELGENAGTGAVWIKTLYGRTGRIHVRASHPVLGASSIDVEVIPMQLEAV